MSVDWAVAGRALDEPTRAGGINAEKGFAFQRSYAAWLLTGLLTNAGGVVALRYEGAQDVDLWLVGGREIYVQIKGYEATELGWPDFRKILSRFVGDLQAARERGGDRAAARLSFRLVAAASIASTDVLDLCRRKRVASHVKRLVQELSTVAPTAAVEADLQHVVSLLQAELLPAGFPREVFRLMAEARLARFGVGADEVDSTLRILLDALPWRETVGAADVLRWIADRLPPEHPCSEEGAVVAFSRRARGDAAAADLFYTSQSDIWEGIAGGLDVPRELSGQVRDALLADDCPKVLVHGPSGAGKSTLLRRVMWDLQREGRLLALEFRGPDLTEAEWRTMLKLAGRLRSEEGPRVVLLVDDIHENPLLAQRIAELDGESDLGVVATAWTADAGGVALGAGLLRLELARISRQEAELAAERLGRSLVSIPEGRLTDLLDAGQFVVLNIVLLEGGDMAAFGRRLLASVVARAPSLTEAYLDLCACGAGDRSVPLGLVDRVHGNVVDLIASPAMRGLVFTAGPDRARSGHRVLAAAVVAAGPSTRLARLLALAKALEVADPSERRFGIGLLEDAVASEEFTPALAALVGRLAVAFASPGQYLDVRRCSRLLSSAGLAEQAALVDALAVFDRVETGPDAAAFRSDWAAADPEGAFDQLMGFYADNPTTWGWRNFLQVAKDLDAGRRARALSLAGARLAATPDAATAKTIIDLMNARGGLPAWTVDLAVSVLGCVPDSPALARATSQLVIDHFRSPRVFAALLRYAANLLGPSGEGLRLSRHLTSAAKHADADDRRRLLLILLGLVDGAREAHDRATLVHLCASLATGSDVPMVEAKLGSVSDGEPRRLNAARHILRKKRARP